MMCGLAFAAHLAEYANQLILPSGNEVFRRGPLLTGTSLTLYNYDLSFIYCY